MATPPSDNIKEAARITVGFVALYSVSFWNILITKKRLVRVAKEKGVEFDRYNDPAMHDADRLQANFLEWSPVFLGLVGSLAATENLSPSCVIASRAYLGFRALYTALVLKYGVRRTGFQFHLWIATFPAYASLVWLSHHAVFKLF
jgi:uncharacterized MAPEG superfamily protein